jgi:hypothetical protein
MPSFGKTFIASAINALLLFMALAQIGGTIIDLENGETSPDVWACGDIGVTCLFAIPLVFRWGTRPR